MQEQERKKKQNWCFFYSFVEKVKEFSLSRFLILSFDQTPSKFVPASILANSKQVRKVGGSDNRFMTAMSTITLSGSFLGIKLIYGGKTEQSLSRYKFPEKFSLK